MKVTGKNRHYYRFHAAPHLSFLPSQLADRYGYPANTTGSGQKTGIIELGGGFKQEDWNAYFASRSVAVPKVTLITAGNGSNSPTGHQNGPDAEVMLDVCVVGDCARRAELVVCFGDNSDSGYLAAYTALRRFGCDQITTSWGSPESQWSQQVRNSFDSEFQLGNSQGVTYSAASGDSGSGDGLPGRNMDYPASSPWVVSCGATRINSDNSEVVWGPPGAGNGATGGGFSKLYNRPDWQPSVSGSQSRMGPDIVMNGDPASGYVVRVDGNTTVIGGTSAVSPMIAALSARVNEAVGKRVSLSNNGFLWTLPDNCFVDITSGSNGEFKASAGPDPCTGRGTPIGSAIVAAVAGGVIVTPPPPPPPGGGNTVTEESVVNAVDSDLRTAANHYQRINRTAYNAILYANQVAKSAIHRAFSGK